MAEFNSPRRAKPEPNTIQSIFNLNKFQGSEELLVHPERWIEAAERKPQPPPPPQQHIRRASPTGASSQSTLPTHLASDASQRNRNRNRIRDENEKRDLVRGSPQSRTQVQAHDPIRHLPRDPIPSRTPDRSPPQQQKQAAMAKYAPPIATPPTPTAPIDNNIATAAFTPKNGNAVTSGMSPSPDRRPFIPPPLFRGSVPQPRPSEPKRERDEKLQTLTTEMRKWSDRGIVSYTKSEPRTLAAQTREKADRWDGSGRYPMFVPRPRVEWHNGDSRREVEGTSGVPNTEQGPRRALQALRHAVPVGWTSRSKKQEDVEMVGRQSRVEEEDGRDGIRDGVAKYPGDRWETDERGKRARRGASGTTFKTEQPPTSSSTAASRTKSKNAGEGGAIEDQCKPPPVHRTSTTNSTSAYREPGPLNMRPAFENWILEVEEDAKRSAEEERPVSKRGGKGVGVAEQVERMNTNMDRRMREPEGSGLEIAGEEAAEDAEWVLVTAPAPAAKPQDAGGEEVENEVEIEVEAENEAEWCVVRT